MSDRDENAIDHAVALLARGGVVAIPTETVYGLAADALDETAVARIFEIKRRPTFDPLIVHVASIADARGLVAAWPAVAERLAAAFWPGPLTLVVEKKPALVPDLVTAGLQSLAIRIPDHPLTLAVLRRLGRPLAAPSANPFGFVSPTTARHVVDSLGDRVDYVLDGGACRTGVESTVVSLLDPERPTLLRPGGAESEAIERVIAPLRLARGDVEVATGIAAKSPGMLASHYAPRTKLGLAGAQNGAAPREGERVGWIGMGSPTEGEYALVESLAARGDFRTAAANLFAALRRLDAAGLDRIVAELPPEEGLGVAIADRLRRASR
jgi:L-threonylcarbamoyladenylate synthase